MSETKKARAVGFNHIALEVGDIDEALAGRADRRAEIVYDETHVIEMARIAYCFIVQFSNAMFALWPPRPRC